MTEKKGPNRFFVTADKMDLFTAYLRRRHADVETLLKCLETKDFETVQRLGHKMCGNGGIFGFDQITKIGQNIESAAMFKDLGEIRKHTQELSEYLATIEIFPTDEKTKSLLIIDDDEDIGDALVTFLNEEGYTVRLASSGKQGLELAQADVPRIILLDWQMPQMNGLEVLTKLESLPALKDVPVILMSANIANIPAAVLKTRKHLSKPFDVDVLMGLVSQVLSS